MTNQTNQEQEKDKATATGINSEAIKLDFNQLKAGLSGFVRETGEKALNGLLQAEAEDLCSAKRHEPNEGRKAYRRREPNVVEPLTAMYVAVAANQRGVREVVGVVDERKEDGESRLGGAA